MTVPFVVVVTLVLIALRAPSDEATDDGGPLSFPAPPSASAQAEPCAKLIAELPVQLDKLAQRVVKTEPEIPSVVAWGTPAIVLRCGIARPKSFQPDSQLRTGGTTPTSGDDGPWYDITPDGDANVWTVVDRGPWISVTVPSKYTAAGPLTELSRLIKQTLPAVCRTDAAAPPESLCTRRP